MRTGDQASAERHAVSLGDSALSPSAAEAKNTPKPVIAMELPKKPRPGQRRPDAKGRCPAKQIAINGGCWIKVDFTPEECLVTGFEHQGGCYVPIYVSSNEPTSAPQER